MNFFGLLRAFVTFLLLIFEFIEKFWIVSYRILREKNKSIQIHNFFVNKGPLLRFKNVKNYPYFYSKVLKNVRKGKMKEKQRGSK